MTATLGIILFPLFVIDRFSYGQVEAEFLTPMNPIRIHAHFQQFDSDLTENDISTIKESVQIVLTYVQQVLAVNSLNRPLLLKRRACAQAWVGGPNKAKCAYKRRGYVGEFCKGDFKIPDKHLEEFVVWDFNASEPKTLFRSGEGVRHADYILYVQAMTTSECVMANFKTSSKSLIAYAAECKLGRYGLQIAEDGRPLAGYINVCPSMFDGAKENRHKLILTLIHEVFHSLGFSKHYFGGFKDCYGRAAGSICPSQKFPLFRKIGNYTRILTNNVIWQMQNHFLCYKSDFGGPLEIERYRVQSHWDGLQMYGSIMSPSLGPPELIFVDPVSLALFEDSGWYRVNYSMAEDYPWGRGKGCDFGKDFSKFDDATCKFDGVKVENGCNVFHTHMIACNKKNVLENEIAFDNICHVCGNAEYLKTDELTLSRCLLSNISHNSAGFFTNNLKGQCFKIQCLDSKVIEIFINDTFSVPCPLGSHIHLTLFSMDLTGVIVCPREADLICFQKKKPIYLQNSEILTTTPMVTTQNTALSELSDIYSTTIDNPRQTLASNARSVAAYEYFITKMLYTSAFCLIVLHVKIIDNLVFCMF